MMVPGNVALPPSLFLLFQLFPKLILNANAISPPLPLQVFFGGFLFLFFVVEITQTSQERRKEFPFEVIKLVIAETRLLLCGCSVLGTSECYDTVRQCLARQWHV